MFRIFQKKTKINYREEQEKQLQKVGLDLRKARLEKGLSVENLAQQTRVPVRLLKAIEDGILDALPEPIYTKGLIKKFAEAVGLDGIEMAKAFPDYQAVKSRRSYVNWQFPSLQLQPIYLYIFYIFLIIFSIRTISQSLQESVIILSPPAPDHKIITSVSPREEHKPTTGLDSKPVVVSIQLKDECWLKVVVDGKTEFEGVLPRGSDRTWSAQKELTIRAGNAGGVYVMFNNQIPKKLGKPGQVQEITFQAQAR